ncbi:hypothetical protein NEUTE2DRAFT_68689, partial [Neurospora tetrasperma FGSC 2509]
KTSFKALHCKDKYPALKCFPSNFIYYTNCDNLEGSPEFTSWKYFELQFTLQIHQRKKFGQLSWLNSVFGREPERHPLHFAQSPSFHASPGYSPMGSLPLVACHLRASVAVIYSEIYL